jgi:hypothetical protein
MSNLVFILYYKVDSGFIYIFSLDYFTAIFYIKYYSSLI